MSIIGTLVELFPVRKSGKQKEAFRDWFIAWAREQGYTAQATTPRGFFHSTNVVVGDPENAQVVFTAHYDTPAAMIVPNFITPCNVLTYILYNILVVPIILLPPAAVGFLVYFLVKLFGGDDDLARSIAGPAAFVSVYVTLGIMMFGPANRNNVNDNTSGVAAVMEMMQRLPEEQREKAAFILFDNEEKGMLGSGAYAASHKTVKTEKLLINMDCVGDGENILFFANKKTRQLPCFPALEAAMQAQEGRHFLMNKIETSVYPSDQTNYKLGIAVCACKKMKVVGYYCDRIHTKKDTVCEQANLDFLAGGLIRFVETL